MQYSTTAVESGNTSHFLITQTIIYRTLYLELHGWPLSPPIDTGARHSQYAGPDSRTNSHEVFYLR